MQKLNCYKLHWIKDKERQIYRHSPDHVLDSTVLEFDHSTWTVNGYEQKCKMHFSVEPLFWPITEPLALWRSRCSFLICTTNNSTQYCQQVVRKLCDFIQLNYLQVLLKLIYIAWWQWLFVNFILATRLWQDCWQDCHCWSHWYTMLSHFDCECIAFLPWCDWNSLILAAWLSTFSLIKTLSYICI